VVRESDEEDEDGGIGDEGDRGGRGGGITGCISGEDGAEDSDEDLAVGRGSRTDDGSAFCPFFLGAMMLLVSGAVSRRCGGIQ
jgi:hypothetical protein